jgi:hypothetical protein
LHAFLLRPTQAPEASQGGSSTMHCILLHHRTYRLAACSFSWWLVLICAERKVLLAGF